jgi:hypothetical protein
MEIQLTFGLPKWVGARRLVIVSFSAPTSWMRRLFILSSLLVNSRLGVSQCPVTNSILAVRYMCISILPSTSSASTAWSSE